MKGTEALAECQAERDKYRTLVMQAATALKRTGIIGIHAEFTDLGDAIDQMGSHIKELELDLFMLRFKPTENDPCGWCGAAYNEEHHIECGYRALYGKPG